MRRFGAGKRRAGNGAPLRIRLSAGKRLRTSVFSRMPWPFRRHFRLTKTGEREIIHTESNKDTDAHGQSRGRLPEEKSIWQETEMIPKRSGN